MNLPFCRSTSSPVPRTTSQERRTPTNRSTNNLPKEPTSNLPKQSIKPTDLPRKPTQNNLPMVLDVCGSSHLPGGNHNTSNHLLEVSYSSFYQGLIRIPVVKKICFLVPELCFDKMFYYFFSPIVRNVVNRFPKI